MDREIRLKRDPYGPFAAFLICPLVVCGMLAVAYVTNDPIARTTALCGVPVFGVLIFLAVETLIEYRVWSLKFNGSHVTCRTLWKTTSFSLEEITTAKWVAFRPGSIRLRSPGGRLTIRFHRFEHDDALSMIRHFHETIPRHVQQGWEPFCRGIAIPLRDPPSPKPKIAAPTEPHPDFVLLTRKRWDRIGIIGTILVGLSAALVAWYTSRPYLLLFTLFPVSLWQAFRRSVPPQGKVEPRLQLKSPHRSFEGAIMCYELSSLAFVFGVFLFFDKSHSLFQGRNPLVVAIAIVGCAFCGLRLRRLYRAERRLRRDENAERDTRTNAEWETGETTTATRESSPLS